MKKSFAVLLLIIAPLAQAATFAERVSAAHEVEKQPDAANYFKEKMFPAINNSLASAMRKCAAMPNANVEDFAVVADVTASGKFVNVDYQPRTNTAACFSAVMAGLLVPPPVKYGAPALPIVIEMSVTRLSRP